MTKVIIGIVGKPSSGKSTFLNAACLTNAKVSELPFTTIDANKGIAYVKEKCVCKDLNIKDNPNNSICINGNRFIPINLLDVAGLVPDAHKGKGLGNKFLNDLSRADVLLHVVDITGTLDKGGNRVSSGFSDPFEDIQFLENEINLWFKEIFQREDWERFQKTMRGRKTIIDDLHNRLSGLKIKKWQIHEVLKKLNIENKNPSDWTEEEILNFSRVLREISKPILIVANKIDKESSLLNLNKLKEKYNGQIIACSALAEYYLRKYDEEKKIRYIPGDTDFEILNEQELNSEELKLLDKIKKSILVKYNGTGVQNALNYAIFNIIGLITVYPVADISTFSDKSNNVLPDVFLIRKGTTLKEFVNKNIHSDLAKHFIHGIDAISKKRLGENYELKHNDIIKIVSAK